MTGAAIHPPRIEVNRQRCIGSGNCLFYAEHTFDLDDDDRAIVVDPLGDDADKQRTAVESCPAGALAFVGEVSKGE